MNNSQSIERYVNLGAFASCLIRVLGGSVHNKTMDDSYEDDSYEDDSEESKDEPRLGFHQGLKRALGELRLPKDAVTFVVSQAEKSRKDISRLVGGEIRNAIDQLDLAGELRRALAGLDVDIRIRFTERDSDTVSNSAPKSNAETAEEDPLPKP